MQLVQVLSDTSWCLNRVAVLENSLLIAENEASVNTDHPKILTALAMAKTYREQNQAVANLATHGQRLDRLFKETLKQLHEIQAERRSLEKEQQKMAPSSCKCTMTKGLPTARRKMASFFQKPKWRPASSETFD